MFPQEDFQLLPIEEIFIGYVRQVIIRREEIVFSAPMLFSWFSASSSEEASFIRLLSNEGCPFSPRRSRSNFDFMTSVRVALLTMGTNFT